MPDDYYVSQYSGEEIDALLGGVGTGTVRYDAAQTLTDAQKTQARGNIGAAPSGGGVMERAPEVAASSASESYAAFCAKLDAVLETMPASSVKFLQVYPPQYSGYGHDMCALYKSNNDYASVYTIGSYNDKRQGFRMIKHKTYDSDPAGQWDPLEYINPDMQLGVEYRTTERFLGKPVYVKVVNFGTAPNNDSKSVSISDMNIDEVCDAIFHYYIPSSGENGVMTCHPNFTGLLVNSDVIQIRTNADETDINFYTTIKYTKNTN